MFNIVLNLSVSKAWIWLFAIVAFDLLILAIYLHKKKKKAREAAELEVLETASSTPLQEKIDTTSPTKNAIYLFGSFKIFNAEEIEITNKFTPLLKELFLLIVLNSTNKNNGISSGTIVEKLWSDMPIKNGRNNLAVNIGKLKAALGIDFQDYLTSNSGVWKFEIPNENSRIYCDYQTSLQHLNSPQKLSISEIKELMTIVNKGGLLTDQSYEWLDSYKATISNKLIDAFQDFLNSNSDNLSPTLLIQIADSITQLDMINETAMEIKCRALVALGKHSIANETFTKFVKEYTLLYNIPFQKDFKSIIG
ncbi:MAG: hypothetical protein KBG80_09140 [Breznakibacter sp.]|nr:hypothetical protein [Breznakibacter sp.]